MLFLSLAPRSIADFAETAPNVRAAFPKAIKGKPENEGPPSLASSEGSHSATCTKRCISVR
ncbi:hypothetical protein [Sphingosinicella sp. BN140058]|uniref:hypothetical protein n=1 Tax=Sphingosinicella sp. BN140058 TaxID=1892855 RepID=UPI001013C1A1|nr:hypothetical protein [Sphingosinicella sp. BN140058]QAY76124.1 hypothetical protein ETR14_05965 [Sphingosinicella sp. BN140058]